MNHTQFLWTLVATQLILIGFAWTAALSISRGYRPGIVGLVAFNLVLGASLISCDRVVTVSTDCA